MFSTANGVRLLAAIVFLKLALRHLSVWQEHSAVAVVTGIVANMVKSLNSCKQNLKPQSYMKSILHAPEASLREIKIFSQHSSFVCGHTNLHSKIVLD
jgi:hypothetical protein